MIINEKKFKIFSIFFGVIFLLIICVSFYYIYNIKNIKNNEKISDKNIDMNFEKEKNSDSVMRMINNLDKENSTKQIKNEDKENSLTEKELLSKKILMAKMEDRKSLKLDYIKEKITNEDVIDFYLKYKKANLDIDFKNFEVLTGFFKSNELNEIIFSSYKKDFSSSVSNVINNYDLLDGIYKNYLKELNQEIFNFKEEKNTSYMTQKEEIDNDKNLTIDDLKIKLMILRDSLNDDIQKYINEVSLKEKIIKDRIDLLLKIYSKVLVLEDNEINKELLLEYNREILTKNENIVFIYNMNYISDILLEKYKSNNSEDIGFKNFITIYLDEFKKPKLDILTTKTKDEISMLGLDIKKPFLSVTNKIFGYDDLTEEDINNIFKMLP